EKEGGRKRRKEEGREGRRKEEKEEEAEEEGREGRARARLRGDRRRRSEGDCQQRGAQEGGLRGTRGAAERVPVRTGDPSFLSLHYGQVRLHGIAPIWSWRWRIRIRQGGVRLGGQQLRIVSKVLCNSTTPLFPCHRSIEGMEKTRGGEEDRCLLKPSPDGRLLPPSTVRLLSTSLLSLSLHYGQVRLHG
ncbi:hypothetical protein PMAYCL1PPCAC_32883, partial [Pristionchus mayeri]